MATPDETPVDSIGTDDPGTGIPPFPLMRIPPLLSESRGPSLPPPRGKRPLRVRALAFARRILVRVERVVLHAAVIVVLAVMVFRLMLYPARSEQQAIDALKKDYSAGVSRSTFATDDPDKTPTDWEWIVTAATHGGLWHVQEKSVGFGPKLPKEKHHLLRRIRCITELRIWGDSFTDADMQRLCNLNSLVSLELHCPRVTGEGLAALESPEIKLLDLSESGIGDVAMSSLTKMPKLALLKLDKTHITDAGLEPLEGNSSIAWLTLNETRITDRGVASICKLGDLYAGLELAGTDITDDALASIPGCFAQRFLSLQRTRVTDQGLLELRAEPEILDVSETGVQLGPEAAVWIAALPNPITIWAVGNGIPPERSAALEVPGRVKIYVGPRENPRDDK
jgi:hypothetical protein